MLENIILIWGTYDKQIVSILVVIKVHSKYVCYSSEAISMVYKATKLHAFQVILGLSMLIWLRS